VIEMVIDSIRINTQSNQHVLVLKEKEGELFLPIWIGPAEADAIAIKIQKVSKPRPLTHDLLFSIISALNATVDLVLLNKIQGDAFYSKIRLNVNGKDLEIDSRPSDSIALAIKAEAPIYADESVLKEGGIIFDKDTGQPVVPSKGEEAKGEQLSEDELKKLSAFRDFVDKINLDDLGKKDS
jgi:uncharacterized protein